MHEVSVALDLIRAVVSAAEQHGAGRVTRVGVRIGTLSSVDPQALAFAFPECALDTLAAGAVLDIESVPVVARCPQCGEVRPDLRQGLRCPHCDRPTPEVLAGTELELDSLELL